MLITTIVRRENDLQPMVDAHNNYCKTWKRTVNLFFKIRLSYSEVPKTSVKVFLYTLEIENVNEYKYKGIWLEKNNNFKLHTHTQSIF